MSAEKNRAHQEKDYRPLPDGELARLRATLAQRQEYIAVLEVELFNTRAELNEFTDVYNQRITPLQRRANQLRKVLYEALEERKQFEMPTPDFNGNGRHASEPRQNERKRSQVKQKTRRRADEVEKEPKRPDPKLEERLKTLFRMLAKRFHPDLSPNPEERGWREEIMAQVNQAYATHNLEALLALAERPNGNGQPADQTRAEEIAYLKSEIARLDKVVADIEATLKQIEVSPAMQLSREVTTARRRGRDLLAQMARDLAMQIEELEEHLLALGVEAQSIAIV